MESRGALMAEFGTRGQRAEAELAAAKYAQRHPDGPERRRRIRRALRQLRAR